MFCTCYEFSVFVAKLIDNRFSPLTNFLAYFLGMFALNAHCHMRMFDAYNELQICIGCLTWFVSKYGVAGDRRLSPANIRKIC